MTNARLLALRARLQKALELEFFTLPPYLCALYSIPEGKNAESVQILQSVVMEEMLHLALVANVLNAVGGEPQISPRLGTGLVRKSYPSNLPHVDMQLSVQLRKFGPDAIRTFMAIEAPERPEDWADATRRGRIQSIGHFYDLLLDQLVSTAIDLGEEAVFSGDPNRQLQLEHYYGGGGNILPIRCLTDAKDAIVEVAQQGEGRKLSNVTGDSERFGQPKEVAHFYRFKQILAGRYYERDDEVQDPTGLPLSADWAAVLPMRDDPRSDEDLPSSSRELWTQLDNDYAELLDIIHRAFNGEPSELHLAIPTMYRLRHKATALMNVPRQDGTTLGPPLWFVQMT